MPFPRPLPACVLALACAALPAFAFDAGDALGPGMANGDDRMVAMRMSAEGVVTAVDARGRLMSVERPRDTLTLRLDPRVRNAGAIRVGEQVRVDYVAAFVLRPRRGDGFVPRAAEHERRNLQAASLANRYAQPVAFPAEVVGVDKENLVVRLRGPAGKVSEYPVQDRSALAGMRLGQQVDVVMNQAVAVGVEPLRR